MNNFLKLGTFELYWLKGGRFALDGGTMFGVVPKKLWEKKYEADKENFVPLVAWPILVKTPETVAVIETGFGNKLTEKQRKIFRVRDGWHVPESLRELGISREDVEYVVLTHLDFDHAGGIVMEDSGGLSLTFPRAKHIVQRQEWHDALHPSKRAAHSYWPINFELLKERGSLELVEGNTSVATGIGTFLSGGHHRGHQIITLASEGETALHMGDVLPTHAHFNPLWVMAYDDFPLDVIHLKEEWERRGVRDGTWFTFYHDTSLLACKFDAKGEITERLSAN